MDGWVHSAVLWFTPLLLFVCLVVSFFPRSFFPREEKQEQEEWGPLYLLV